MGRVGALAAVVLGAAAVSGCGGDGDSAGDLRWQGSPRVFRQPALPSDRILQGTVKNDSLREVKLEPRALRVVDAAGRRLRSSAAFLPSYGRGSYPRSRVRPGELPEDEKIRQGLLAKIAPGGTAPLTVSWTVRGGMKAARIEYGAGSLPVP